MDNLDIYLYIIILIIYAVTRIFKTANKNAPVRPAQRKQPVQTPAQGEVETPRKRPFSFEDILREFEKGFQEETGEPAVESHMPSESFRPPPPVPASRPTTEESASDTVYHTYEGQSYEDIPSYEEKGHPAEKPVYERSAKYKIDKAGVHEIVKKIRQPGGIRDAIIFNEIINRKYF